MEVLSPKDTSLAFVAMLLAPIATALAAVDVTLELVPMAVLLSAPFSTVAPYPKALD